MGGSLVGVVDFLIGERQISGLCRRGIFFSGDECLII